MAWLEWHLDRLLPFDRSDVVAVEQDVKGATSKLKDDSLSESDQLQRCRHRPPPFSRISQVCVWFEEGRSFPTAGDEALGVEHGRHDMPCQPVDHEERRRESEGHGRGEVV